MSVAKVNMIYTNDIDCHWLKLQYISYYAIINIYNFHTFKKSGHQICSNEGFLKGILLMPFQPENSETWARPEVEVHAKNIN